MVALYFAAATVSLLVLQHLVRETEHAIAVLLSAWVLWISLHQLVATLLVHKADEGAK